MKYEVCEARDGSIILSCGEEHDLVFSMGALRGDPEQLKQKELAMHIAEVMNENET